jgi:hypothetical protein
VLAQCFDRARAQGMSVAVTCNERMAELLGSLGLDAEVAVVATRDEALALSGSPAGAAPEGEPPYRSALRAARQAIEGGSVPADDEELALLRRALEEAPPAQGS